MKSTWAFRLSISIILALSILITTYIVVLVTPTSYWFKYQKLEVKSAYKDLYMISTYEKSIAEPLIYNDILFCDFGDGLVRFSSNMSKSVAKSSALRSVIWRYEGLTPNMQCVCTIESQIDVLVPFSVVKSQTIKSLPFIFTP